MDLVMNHFEEQLQPFVDQLARAHHGDMTRAGLWNALCAVVDVVKAAPHTVEQKDDWSLRFSEGEDLLSWIDAAPESLFKVLMDGRIRGGRQYAVVVTDYFAPNGTDDAKMLVYKVAMLTAFLPTLPWVLLTPFNEDSGLDALFDLLRQNQKEDHVTSLHLSLCAPTHGLLAQALPMLREQYPTLSKVVVYSGHENTKGWTEADRFALAAHVAMTRVGMSRGHVIDVCANTFAAKLDEQQRRELSTLVPTLPSHLSPACKRPTGFEFVGEKAGASLSDVLQALPYFHAGTQREGLDVFPRSSEAAVSTQLTAFVGLFERFGWIEYDNGHWHFDRDTQSTSVHEAPVAFSDPQFQSVGCRALVPRLKPQAFARAMAFMRYLYLGQRADESAESELVDNLVQFFVS